MVRMPVAAGKAKATRSRTVALFNKKAAKAPVAPKGKAPAPKAGRGAVQQRGVAPVPGVSVKQYLGLGTSVNPFGFSKANELFVGRMAMLGFSAALIGELQTGVGPLEQLGFETGIPLYEVDDLLLFSIIFTAVAALLPGTGKFVDENGNELV